ncbi:hypothetical protein Tco_1077614, partial [Tanacetum coccineum]
LGVVDGPDGTEHGYQGRYKMAEENVPAPTRTDEQLVPIKARLSIGKSNLLMDLQKMQKNLIFRISCFGNHPKDSAHPFVAPLAGDLVIDFMNNLGYPKELQFVSKMYVNSLYQPWRTILSMMNQCLTGKTSGSDRPRNPVLQILWGVVLGTNIDYAELFWEEFFQAIKTFLFDAANLKVPTKKPKPHSPLHITVDDYLLGNLKFVPKGELDKVFRMPIPKDLITDVIRNSEYYYKYLEMVVCKSRQATTMIDEEDGKKKKAPPTRTSKQHAPAKQSKPVKEKNSKPTPSKKIPKGKVMKVRNGKRSDHLVDEEDEEVQHAPKPQVEDDEYNLQRGIRIFQEEKARVNVCSTSSNRF